MQYGPSHSTLHRNNIKSIIFVLYFVFIKRIIMFRYGHVYVMLIRVWY